MNSPDNTLCPSPMFSVVIPAYNVGAYLEETLGSVYGQQYSDFEIIVVDDGSTDETQAVLDRQEDPRLRVITQQNGGASRARNRGIREARGHYVALLDGDDLWAPDHLRLAAEFFERNPDTAWYASRWTRAHASDEKWKTILQGNAERPEAVNVNFFRGGANNISSSTLVIRRDLPDGEMYPENISYGEDLIAHAQIAARHPTIGITPAVTALYRQRYGSAMLASVDLTEKVRQDANLFRRFMEVPSDETTATDIKRYIQYQSLQFWTNRIMCSKQERWLPYIRERRSATGLIPSLWIGLFAISSAVLAFTFGLPLKWWINLKFNKRSHL